MSAVKMAYSSKELSDLLGIAHKNILARAKRESWQALHRAKKLGGNEWLLESMPAPTRQAIGMRVAENLAQSHAEISPWTSPQAFTVNTLQDVPERKRKRAGARALVVSLAHEHGAASGVARSTAYEIFAHLYNTNAIEVPEWVREFLPHISRNSIRNWEDGLAKNGVAALAGKYGRHLLGGGTIDSTPGMADLVAAHIYEFYDVTAEYIMRALRLKFKGHPLPSLRSLQRWMKKYRDDNAQTILKIQNPDGWRSKYQSAAGSRSEHITAINELWELDCSPADVLLADGKRYTVIGGIDVATRRTILQLAESANSNAVCALLRRCFLLFGIAKGIKMDNGPEYNNFQVVTVLHDLHINPEWCTKFAPEEKPHIERFFRTFQSGLTTLPGFIGHSVADRKAIESRRSFAERVSRKKGEKVVLELRYTPEEFQRYCDIWCEDIYGEKVHSSLGVSPNEEAARQEATIQRVSDERALDLLLMPIARKDGQCRVTKKGIKVDKGTFNAPELGGLEGEDVQVRLDGRDAGYVYVFDLDGIFICRAENPDLTGVSRRDLALARKRFQKAVVSEKTKEAKKIVATVKPQELVELIVAADMEQAEANRADRQLRYGAHASEEYSTPALDQAARAVLSNLRYKMPHLTDEELQAEMKARDAFLALKASEARAKAELGDGDINLADLEGREALWAFLKVEDKLRDRKQLNKDQARFYDGYQNTHGCATMRKLYDIHGEELFDGVEITPGMERAVL